jgi:hypothetical protein
MLFGSSRRCSPEEQRAHGVHVARNEVESKPLKTHGAAPSPISPPFAIKDLRGPERNRRLRRVSFHFVSLRFHFGWFRLVAPSAAPRPQRRARPRGRFIFLKPSVFAAP